MTNDQRLGAMLSVRVSAYRAGHVLPRSIRLECLGLPTLGQAVYILKTDTDPIANSRRRRAVAKLVAYGRRDREIQAAVRSLLYDLPKDLAAINALERRYPRLSPVAFEPRAYQVLTSLRISGCGPEELHPAPATIAKPFPPISVSATATVSPDVDWVSQRIDPQRWDRCSLIFKRPPGTYLTTGPFTKTTACPMAPLNGNPVPSSPNALGSAYQGYLFEYADCGSCQAEFKNVLTINTVRQPISCPSCPANGYTVHYDIHKVGTLAGCVTLSGSPTHAEWDQDDGTVTAAPSTSSPGKTDVVLSKNLTLIPAGLDPLLWVLLNTAPVPQEMADELAETACCPLDSPGP